MVEGVKSVAKRKQKHPFVIRYQPPPGKLELEIRKACKFRRGHWETRQEELERLIDTVVEFGGERKKPENLSASKAAYPMTQSASKHWAGSVLQSISRSKDMTCRSRINSNGSRLRCNIFWARLS
jgi:hypothetical protein